VQLDEYKQYDAIALRDLIRSGAVTAPEVEAVARHALDAANRTLNALALPLFSPALEHAEDGPLAGVPFLIKDSGPMAEGTPFSIGSRSLQGVVATRDSDLMTRFRAAGLVTLGLTTVPEMAISFSTESVKHGPTRNPWDSQRGVGGSSGGAAAMVAAGAVPLAHGSDGAGSLRIPASCCGLVGLKPSRGRTPSGPGTGASGLGMNCEFALTRTVRDAAHLLDTIHGPRGDTADTAALAPPRDRYADEMMICPARLKVAVTTRAWSGASVAAEVASATAQAAHVLEDLGHHVSDASPAIDWADVVESAMGEMAAIAAPWLTTARQPPPDQLEAVSRRVLEQSRKFTASDLRGALDAKTRVSRSVGKFFSGYDLLVTPTLGQLPAPHGTLRYDEPRHTTKTWLQSLFDYGPFTAVFNIAGQPAISLPLVQSHRGLPIGVQFVAAHGREDLLLQVAAVLEKAMPWSDRRPMPIATRREARRPIATATSDLKRHAWHTAPPPPSGRQLRAACAVLDQPTDHRP